MTSLDDLALFVRIAEAGSLAAAARSAELPKSSVSRRLATLEGRLGVSLIRRSTRRLALTDAGRALFERCAPLVAGLRAAESDVIDAPAEPHGRLRVTATGAFGRQFIGPLLSRFLERHPKVSAELVLLDRPVDLIAEGFDVAIRMGPLASSSLLRRKLAEIERVLCAAPAYLDRVGQVADLDELRRHEAVTSVEGNHWTFVADKGTRSVTLAGRFAGNDLATLRDAARRGCGVAILPLFLVEDDLRSGRLARLLPSNPPVPGAATALWPNTRNLPSRTRGLIDFLIEHLSDTRGGPPP